MRENPCNVTTRGSRDLDVPPLPRPVEVPLPANVRRFPIIIGPEAVAAMSRRQDEIAREKAIARHKRRKGRCKPFEMIAQHMRRPNNERA